MRFLRFDTALQKKLALIRFDFDFIHFSNLTELKIVYLLSALLENHSVPQLEATEA